MSCDEMPLQHAATHCNTYRCNMWCRVMRCHCWIYRYKYGYMSGILSCGMLCDDMSLSHTATRIPAAQCDCNTMQHTEIHCIPHTWGMGCCVHLITATHCNAHTRSTIWLLHTATHCNTHTCDVGCRVVRCHCNTLQHSYLQHNVTVIHCHCHALQRTYLTYGMPCDERSLQHNATCTSAAHCNTHICNTLKHTATHIPVMQGVVWWDSLQHIATTIPATLCNTHILQHTTIHCNAHTSDAGCRVMQDQTDSCLGTYHCHRAFASIQTTDVCVYVCVWVYTCTHTCIHMYIYIYTYVYTHVCEYIYLY